MSLLMKALEKAAKDRGETRPPEPTSAAAPTPTPAPEPAARTPKLELTLEPLQADTPPPQPEPAAASPRAAAQSRNERNQARAATVMQATARSTPEAPVRGARFRLSPVMMLGIAGGIAALGFAVYVYLQVTNPGLFIRKPPPAPQPLAQPAPVQAPIATGAVVAPATPAEAATATREERETQRPAQAAAAAPQPPSARAPEAASSRIQISAGSAEPQTDNRLTQAYAALQSGKGDNARQLYGDVVRSDPRNINALLGLAAVALQQGQTDEASRLYMNVLELEPRNPYAQTGLIGMMGRADPAAAEARLKQLIARGPSAALHFTLGNVYADQSRWAEAQQAYFQAHHLEPSNPDYAYNLAVGLEHVGQPKLAAGFYRQAVDLAQTRGRAGFNLAQAQDRIRQLSTQQ